MKYRMDLSDNADAQKQWSGWAAERPKSMMTVSNFLTAIVLTMSTFLVVSNHMV